MLQSFTFEQLQQDRLDRTIGPLPDGARVEGRVTVDRPVFGNGAPTYAVEFHWSGVDVTRPHSHSISAGHDRALAQRLADACNRGLTHDLAEAVVMRDRVGGTYVESRCRVLGRYLRADLDRIGA